MATIDSPPAYARRLAPDEATALSRRRIVEQVAMAGRARSAMAKAMNESPPVVPLAGTTLADDLSTASRFVCNGRELRPMQMEALRKLFSLKNVKKKLLVIHPTRQQKYHVISMQGIMLRGVHWIVHPLLVLTSGQVASFSRYLDAYGAIFVINLDAQAFGSFAVLQKITDLITCLSKRTMTPVFLFGSLQFLQADGGSIAL